MKRAVRSVVVVVAGCVVGLGWVFTDGAVADTTARDVSVIGGVAVVVSVAVAVVLVIRRATTGRAAAGGSVSRSQDALEYLAAQTLRYWQEQARAWRITTPSPVSVRRLWPGQDVAVPADQLQPAPLTAGVVTRLREQVYAGLDGRGRLVVLGGAGAGKTTTMLLLLIDVLQHRPVGSGEPVPVWLTLGGWNPDTTSLRVWAAATLARDYPGLAATTHGGAAGLIHTGRVVLFLDGLDELPPDLQGRAWQAVDRDVSGIPVVLTSRPTEYAAAVERGRLRGAGVIEVLPVDVDHAAAFLLADQLGDHRDAWQQVIDHVRAEPGSVLARTLTTPLALSLARDTYADPTALLDTRAHPTPEALLQHLLARSLDLAYPDLTEREHALRWLSWIARHLGAGRDLRWWDIPTWTPRWHGRLARAIRFWHRRELAEKPRRFDVRRLSRPELRQLLLVNGLGPGVAVGLCIGVEAVAKFGPEAGLAAGLASGLLSGLAGQVLGLTELWRRHPSATARTTSPIEVYRSDRRHALAYGLTGVGVGLAAGLGVGLLAGFGVGLVLGLVAGLVAGPQAGLQAGLAAWLVVGSVTGSVAGSAVGLRMVLPFGLGPAAQLTVMEWFWRRQGQRVRFMPLLQTASDRHVVRQVGAIYQFRHAALQDLLAGLRAAEGKGLRP